MGMLSRYQKSGGFLQLVQLIETTGKQKQENFLNMIEKEDARWALALKEKMLTIERILAWDDNTVSEIAGRLQELTIATAMHGLSAEDCERLLKTFSHSQKRIIDDLKASKTPTAAEVSSAFIKILQEVRNMITHGYIRMDKVAPEMVIPEDFEDKIGKSMQVESRASSTEAGVPNMEGFGSSAPAASHSAAGNSVGPSHGPVVDINEFNSLRGRAQTLLKENNELKNEIRILRDKLTQIRKIA